MKGQSENWKQVKVTSSLLNVLLALFCLRVLGQFLVAFYHVSFLPPMKEWQSGLLPYPALLVCQIAIIAIYGKVCLDFHKRSGFSYAPNAVLSKPLFLFAFCYFVAVAIRLIVWLTLFKHNPRFSGTIPIFFHFVLSTFLIVLSHNHQRRLSQSMDGRIPMLATSLLAKKG